MRVLNQIINLFKYLVSNWVEKVAEFGPKTSKGFTKSVAHPLPN